MQMCKPPAVAKAEELDGAEGAVLELERKKHSFCL